MRLVHTTAARNLDSIRRYGLLLSYCRQKRKANWFHTKAANRWAETHVRVGHDWYDAGLVHITFDVPDKWVKKHSGDLYYILFDLPAKFITSIQLVTRHVTDLPV